MMDVKFLAHSCLERRRQQKQASLRQGPTNH